MEEDKRMRTMQELDKRDKCPQCGVHNNCALEKGKSIHTCWCYGESLEGTIEEAYDSCLCRSCLNKTI